MTLKEETMMDKKTLVVSNEFPVGSLTDCIVLGDKELAKDIEDETMKLIDEYDVDDPSNEEMIENYGIVADDMGARIVFENSITKTEEKTVVKEKKEDKMDIVLHSIRKITHKSTRAFADLQYGQLLIKNFRLVENTKGELFMSMPTQVNKDKQWHSTVKVVDQDSEFKAQAEKILIEAYNA